MKYFNYKEFDSPDEPGSGNKMNEELLHMLDAARKKFGKPIKINSGYRSEAHNRKVGGTSGSSHLKGLAVDIAYNGSVDRFELYNILLEVGFKRIGIGKYFIHVDIDKDKSQRVMWLY
tara:strand:+ start:185 stop:538 length:354 start_codon:yes stop_codon:yes gene_type:complete